MTSEEKLQARREYKRKWAKEKRTKNSDFRKKQNESNRKSLTKKTSNEKEKLKEQLRNTINHKQMRTNEGYKKKNKIAIP